MTSLLLRRCSRASLPFCTRVAPPMIINTTTPKHTTTTTTAGANGVAGKADAPSQPFSKIPRTKTLLGLNLGLLKDPVKSSQYMVEQVRLLGPIFKVTGLPGRPEMVVTVNPQDVEAVYRCGDMHYPERFPFKEWKQTREELKRPLGLFLE